MYPIINGFSDFIVLSKQCNCCHIKGVKSNIIELHFNKEDIIENPSNQIVDNKVEVCFSNDCPNNIGHELSKQIKPEARKKVFFSHKKGESAPNLFVAYGQFGTENAAE